VVIGVGVIKMAFYPKVIEYGISQDTEEFEGMKDMSELEQYEQFLKEFPDARATLQFATMPVMRSSDNPIEFGEVPIKPDIFDDSVEVITDEEEYAKEYKSKYGRRT
jgi:hypothetical protein